MHIVRKPAKPLPAILPRTVYLGRRPLVTITRSRAERGLMTGSVLLAVWRLYHDMGATTEAIGMTIIVLKFVYLVDVFSVTELSLLSGLVTLYLGVRSTKVVENPIHKYSGDTHPTSNPTLSSLNGGSAKGDPTSADPSGISLPTVRNRRQHDPHIIGRSSPVPGPLNSRHEHGAAKQTAPSDTEDASIGSRGLVWATSDRNYRQVRLNGDSDHIFSLPAFTANASTTVQHSRCFWDPFWPRQCTIPRGSLSSRILRKRERLNGPSRHRGYWIGHHLRKLSSMAV